MDESWNFIKEAPENELALVREAYNKCGLQISSSASSEQLVSCILIQHGLDAEDSYEGFLDELCNKNAISIDGLGVEGKGLEVLKSFLAKGIERMSDEQIERFASNYCFSNLDKEKLIREVEVRFKTSNMFRTRLHHIVPGLFGIDFTIIFPSDVTPSDVTMLIVKNGDVGVKYAPIASALITLRNEHNKSNNCDYISKYIDKIIQNNDKKKSILAVIFAIVKMNVNNQDRDSILEEVASFLANVPLSIPDYILNKIPVVDVTNSIMIHFMKQLFPCTMDLQGCYRKMNHVLGDTISTITFFDYKFPYSKVPKLAVSYYRIPDDEIEQKAVMLYLLLSGMDNPKQHLKCENDMKMMNVDYAVVSHEQNIVLKSPKKIVYTEDSLIDHWKDYFDEIEKRPDSIQFEGIMNYLSLFADNRYNTISANLKNIVDQLSIKGYPGFEQLKLILQKIIGQAKVLSNEIK